MSFFEDASLVLIPSAYKDQKVYSVKPTDGTGDLTFSRASSATRVQSDGLIEKVRTNLLLQSQTFDNASWTTAAGGTGSAPVVTANNATAPNGTLTADTIVFNSGAGTTSSDQSIIYQSITLGAGTYTGSFYAKVTSGTGQLMFRHALGGSYTTANLTTSWQRFQSAELTAGATIFFEIGIRRGLNEPINSSVSVEIWGAQLEVSDFGATDYIATTTAAVSVGPVSGLPRLDYLGSTCPRLLLEPQRSNLITFSEQFDNAGWSKLDTAVTANAGTSPDGYTNADKIVPNTSIVRHIIFQSVSASAVHTLSVFAKAAGQNFLTMRLDDDTPEVNVYFNLSTGTIGSTSGGSPTMTSYGNGWYRCTVTYTPSGTETIYAVLGSANQNGVQAYAGNNTDGILLYGAQLEAGAYATSYIPTLGASVTRVVDDCVKSSATSIIGQTEGVVFFEWEYQNTGSSGGNIPISLDGGSGELIYFWVQTDGTYLADVYDGGASLVSMTGSMGSFGTKKIAIAYKSNDFALYINGVLAGTDTSGSVPTLNRLYIGRYTTPDTYNIASGIKQVLLFKTRLTNAQLAELTA